MGYDLKSINAPRLHGASLAALCRAIESRQLSWVLRARFDRDSGLTAFREAAVAGPPSVRPMLPRAATAAPDDGETPSLAAIAALADEDVPPGSFKPQSVVGLARAYRSGVTSPDAVIDGLLAAARRFDDGDRPLRAFIARDDVDVRAQADESTRRLQRGEPRSILEGVPIAVKDELDQLPYPTTAGTSFLGASPATVDATAVARLRALGAVLIGKANMHEIGIGVTGLNVHHGTARNPHDPSRHTGGSSSGSAAAVAAGLCPLAIGADGGGSIRIPAALCGVVGLKATFGRIGEGGVAPLCWSVGHVGPIGATVRDCALGYTAIAGPDPRDPNSRDQPAVRGLAGALASGDLKGLTIGVYRPWFRHAAPELVEVCERALADLVAAGASLREVTVEHLELCRVAHVVTIAAEMARSMEPFMARHRKDFSLEVRINLAIARGLTARDYIKAQQVRTLAVDHWTQLLHDVDVIATPTTAAVAPEIRADALARGESDFVVLSEIMRYAPIPNLTGLPAITYPVGQVGALPVGLQLIGRPWAEHTLFRLAAAGERAASRRRPAVHHDLR
ncbi:MAG: amidase [Myxococcales bacterium]|nr:amidase [Myxococcales bacterium]